MLFNLVLLFILITYLFYHVLYIKFINYLQFYICVSVADMQRLINQIGTPADSPVNRDKLYIHFTQIMTLNL